MRSGRTSFRAFGNARRHTVIVVSSRLLVILLGLAGITACSSTAQRVVSRTKRRAASGCARPRGSNRKKLHGPNPRLTGCERGAVVAPVRRSCAGRIYRLSSDPAGAVLPRRRRQRRRLGCKLRLVSARGPRPLLGRLSPSVAVRSRGTRRLGERGDRRLRDRRSGLCSCVAGAGGEPFLRGSWCGVRDRDVQRRGHGRVSRLRAIEPDRRRRAGRGQPLHLDQAWLPSAAPGSADGDPRHRRSRGALPRNPGQNQSRVASAIDPEVGVGVGAPGSLPTPTARASRRAPPDPSHIHRLRPRRGRAGCTGWRAAGTPIPPPSPANRSTRSSTALQRARPRRARTREAEAPALLAFTSGHPLP